MTEGVAQPAGANDLKEVGLTVVRLLDHGFRQALPPPSTCG